MNQVISILIKDKDMLTAQIIELYSLHNNTNNLYIKNSTTDINNNESKEKKILYDISTINYKLNKVYLLRDKTIYSYDIKSNIISTTNISK